MKKHLTLFVTICLTFGLILGSARAAADTEGTDQTQSVTTAADTTTSETTTLETTTPEYVAKIGDTGYVTVAAAVEAAVDGDTVEIIKDVTEDLPNGIGSKALTLKTDCNVVLNGDSAKNFATASAGGLTFAGSGTLTISGYDIGIYNGNDTLSYKISLQDSIHVVITGSTTNGIKTNGSVTVDIPAGTELDCNASQKENGIYFTNSTAVLNVSGILRCSSNHIDGIYVYYYTPEKADCSLSLTVNAGTIVLDNNGANGICGNNIKRDTAVFSNGAVLEANQNFNQGSVYINYNAKNSTLTANDNNFGFTFSDIKAVNTDVTANNNSSAGWITGTGASSFDTDSSLTLTGNSKGRVGTTPSSSTTAKPVDYRAAIVFVPSYTTSSLTVDAGAAVKITDNYCRAINIQSATQKVTLNSGLIANNNLQDGTYGVTTGGGIYNEGILVIGGSCQVYNNHASTMADDIYNAAGASVTLRNEGSDGLVLDSLGSFNDGLGIDGWYEDGLNTAGTDSAALRWNVSKTTQQQYIVKLGGTYTTSEEAAIKAAHAVPVVIIPVEPVTPTTEIPDTTTPTTDTTSNQTTDNTTDNTTNTTEIDTTKTPVSESPQTGDSQNLILWTVLLACAAVGVVIAITAGRNKKNR